MKYALRLLFASLTIGFISASVIDWDALNGDLLDPLRPAPPKRPAPLTRPLPPIEKEEIEKEFYPPTINNAHDKDMNVQIHSVGDNQLPPQMETIEMRPFEPRPTPPALEESMGPPTPQPRPQQQPEPEPKPERNTKPKPGHHHNYFDLQINEPIGKHPQKPIDVYVKPLDVIDGVVVPTPKYPTHSRPQIDVFYEV